MRSNYQAGLHPRDHGGNLEAAIAQFGGTDWIDLSTGINPVGYPLPKFSTGTWSKLPSKARGELLEQHARAYFNATKASCLAVSGAQAAIQLLPLIFGGGNVAVLGPTYNEHAARFRLHGVSVIEISEIAECPSDVTTLVIVNPNNPDGRVIPCDELFALKRRFKTVIVDESFADVCPKNSICAELGESGLFVLRSFGKFFGLAGARLGFVLGNENEINELREYAGPWAVNGPAIETGILAYADTPWIDATRARLQIDASRLDALARQTGWGIVGGCDLFRLYHVTNAKAVQISLAKLQIWSRIFPYSNHWIRLGLPGIENHWTRLEEAILGG